MKKALVFDFYGTLFDVFSSSSRSSIEIFKEIDLDRHILYNELDRYHQQNIVDLKEFKSEKEIFVSDFELLYKTYHINRNARTDVEMFFNNLRNEEKYLFPEVQDVLLLLKDEYKIYIASNSDNKPFEDDIQKTNVYFDNYFTSEMLKAYKPSRLFFQKLLKNLNLKKEEIYYIGDSLFYDIRGAYDNNIEPIWINRFNQKNRFKNCKTIGNLKQLYEILRPGTGL